MAYRHVVLFRLYDGTTADVADQLTQQLRDVLAHDPGVVSARVERSLDDRKGTVVVEDATFTSRDAYELFRGSPEHQQVAEQMAQHADWLVGDYEL